MDRLLIRDIPVHDGKLTEAGTDLCAQVYEAIKGKCWHKWKYNKWVEHEGTINNAVYCFVCEKCQATFRKDLLSSLPSNPDLLRDLNAVHELEMALKEKWWDYVDALMNILTGDSLYKKPISGSIICAVLAKAHHKLEALATVLDVECGECGGSGVDENTPCSSCPPDAISCEFCRETSCPTCSGTGRVKIIDQWAEKWRGKKRGYMNQGWPWYPIAGIVPLMPHGTNSTLFTECCEVAICDDQPNCPLCKRPVIGHDAETRAERHKIRWRNATHHWKR
jgi:hypothetical protein